jgi:hypothetical protein
VRLDDVYTPPLPTTAPSEFLMALFYADYQFSWR